jgi:excisionase family DNA binding protein
MINHVSQSENTANPTSEVFEVSVSIKEACKILGISRPTLMSLIHKGSLPAFKVGKQWRFKPQSIRDFIDGKGGQHD